MPTKDGRDEHGVSVGLVGSLKVQDIAGLAKPTEKLVEVVSKGIGAIAESWLLPKKARAVAAANLIAAESERDIEALRDRAAHNREIDAIRRQQNLEDIARLAVSALPPKVSENPVDPDWFIRFKESAERVGNPEMQSLWARILASEVAEPGSFSLRAIRTVSDFNKMDAELFTRLCSYIWSAPDGDEFPVHPEAFARGKTPYPAMAFGELAHLQSVGLILHGLSNEYGLKELPDELEYFGDRYSVKNTGTARSGKLLGVGSVWLTAVGQQLVPIAGGSRLPPEYIDSVILRWRNDGYEVARILS